MLKNFARRAGALCVVVSCVIAVGAAAAFAGTAVSAYGFYTTQGIDYRNYAAINTNPSNNHQAYAVTLVSPRSAAAPAGWMGALPRLFRDGALVCSGTWEYNSERVPRNDVLNPSGCFRNQIGTWSSQGVTRAFKKDGTYANFFTFTSPNQNS